MGGGGVVEVWVDLVLTSVEVGYLRWRCLGCLLREVRSMNESAYVGTLLVRASDLFPVPCRAYLEALRASDMIISSIHLLQRIQIYLPPQDRGTKLQLQ